MAPTPIPADRTADAASNASSGFLKWIEENKNVILAGAVGVSAAGLGYYLYSSKGKKGGDAGTAPAGDATGEKASSSKRRRNKKKGKASKEGDALAHPDGPLVQEASDEDIMKLSPEEIGRLPADDRRKSIASQLKSAGNSAYQKGELDKAVNLYTKAIAADPNSAVFYCNRAACYTNQQKYNEVIADTTKAIELDPKYQKALSRRATAYEKLGEDGGSGALDDEKMQYLINALYDQTSVALLSALTNPGVTAQVEQLLQKVSGARAANILANRSPRLPATNTVDNHFKTFQKQTAVKLPETPSGGDKLFGEAITALENKEFVQANELLTKALEADISTNEIKAHALNLRASFEFIKGVPKDAVRDLEESAKVLPDNASSLILQACVLMELGEKDQAFANFDKAIAANPEEPIAYYQRAQVLFLLEDFSKALDDYAKATELDNSFIFSQIQHAGCLFKMGRVTEATQAFQALETKFSTWSEPFNAHGEVLMMQEKYAEAAEKFDAAIAIENAKPAKMRNVIPSVNKALLLLSWKMDMQGAIDLCNEALEVDPECEAAVGTIAQLSMQGGKPGQSIKWFARMSELGRSLPEVQNAVTMEYAARAQTTFMQKYPEEGANLSKVAAQMQ